MLTMAIILTGLSAWIEIKFVRRIKPLWYVMEHGIFGIDPTLCNLVFSVTLSVCLGMLFGVNGLIGFMAGLGSTFITNQYYPHEAQIKRAGAILHAAPERAAAGINKAKDVYADVRQPLHDLGRGIMIVIRVITFPFVAARWLCVKYTELRPSKVTTF
jgi:hypothetical protein